MKFEWTLAFTLCWLLVMASIPAPALANQVVNMEFQQAPLVDVFQILGQLGGYNVLVDPSVSGQVSFSLKDLSVEEALDLVTRTTGYRYQIIGNTMVVASQQRLKSEFGTERFAFVVVEHVPVESAQRLITLLVPGLKSYIDANLDLLVISGFDSDVDQALQVIQQYDRKVFAPVTPATAVPSTPDVPVTQQSAPVYYGDGVHITGLLLQSFPELEFKWEERTHTIQAEALDEEWQQVKAFIRQYDIPVFSVKGILGSGDETFVLIEHQGTTTLLKPGDVLNDWTMTSVENGVVEFALADQTFTIRMGR